MIALMDVPSPKFGDVVGPWHLWFAWRPVYTYDDRLVWLKLVRRRRIQSKEWLADAMIAWWQIAVVD